MKLIRLLRLASLLVASVRTATFTLAADAASNPSSTAKTSPAGMASRILDRPRPARSPPDHGRQNSAQTRFSSGKTAAANFELRLKFKLTPNNDQGRQFRRAVSQQADGSRHVCRRRLSGRHRMGRDIGMLYERRRAASSCSGQKIRISPASAADAPKADGQKKAKAPKAKVDTIATLTTTEELAAGLQEGEWNELRIVASGNHLQHFVNGKVTADVTDTDTEKGAKDRRHGTSTTRPARR